MNKRNTNIILAVALAVLIGILLISKVYKSGKPDKTFNTDLIHIDTNAVTQILLYPLAEKGAEIKFVRDAGTWVVEKDPVRSSTPAGTVSHILAELASIKPDRLASKSRDKWEEYKVTDSLATRIRVMEGNKTSLDLYIGKFSYRKPAQQNRPMYGGNNVEGISYIRINGMDAVYAVNGFLPLTYNQGFNSWREQKLLQADKDKIGEIELTYPADTSFTMLKDSTGWFMGTAKVDAAKIEQYLNTLSRKNCSDFEDQFRPMGIQSYRLVVSSDSTTFYTIDGFVQDSTHVLLHSSLNPESFFSADVNGLFREIFKGRSEMLARDE